MYAKQLTADLLIPDRLDGTKSSANWARPPGGMDRLNTRAVFPSSNEWDIPDLPPSDVRGREGRTLFAAGVEALMEQVGPSCILVYGQADLPEQVLANSDVEIRYYPTRWADGR